MGKKEVQHLPLKSGSISAAEGEAAGIRRKEFTKDAVKLLHMPLSVYVRIMAETMAHPETKILITDYERIRDGDIDPSQFTAMCLDEASALRFYGSKTFQNFRAYPEPVRLLPGGDDGVFDEVRKAPGM